MKKLGVASYARKLLCDGDKKPPDFHLNQSHV